MYAVYVFTGSEQSRAWENRDKIKQAILKERWDAVVWINSMHRDTPVEVYQDGAFNRSHSAHMEQIVKEWL